MDHAWIKDLILSCPEPWPGIGRTRARNNQADVIARNISCAMNSHKMEGVADIFAAIVQGQNLIGEEKLFGPVDNLWRGQMNCLTRTIDQLMNSHPASAHHLLDLVAQFFSRNLSRKMSWLSDLADMFPLNRLEALFARNANLAILVWRVKYRGLYPYWEISGPFGVEFVEKMIPLAKDQKFPAVLIIGVLPRFPGDVICRLLEAWQDPLFPRDLEDMADIAGIAKAREEYYSRVALVMRIALDREKNSHTRSDRRFLTDMCKIIPENKCFDNLIKFVRKHTHALAKSKTTTSKISSIGKTWPTWVPFGHDHDSKVDAFNEQLFDSLRAHVAPDVLCRIVFDFL